MITKEKRRSPFEVNAASQSAGKPGHPQARLEMTSSIKP
jgi:hypothetical protein